MTANTDDDNIEIIGGDDRLVADDDADGKSLTDLVEQPAKVMRIGSMIRQLLEEVKSAPLDDASRQRLKEIHRRSIKELETGLAPELVEELERLTLPFTGDETPSDAELRISQAQLVGWLEGLFHGIQTAIYAQQMAARAQFEQLLAMVDEPYAATVAQRTTARTDFAEALYKLGDRARARKLAQEAIELDGGAGRKRDAAKQQAWLAKHP